MRMSVLTLALAAAFGSAGAADFVDEARVISSVPVYERDSEPRQECWMETVEAPAQQRSMGGAVVGGVVGGLLGSQIGGGHGNTAATAAGAIAGTVIGDKVANPNSDRPVTGAVVGGVAGGLLGSQVGGGTGNKAATAAGAIAGTVVGDRVQNPASGAATRQVRRCRQVEGMREVVSGYDVTYRYKGQDITTRLSYGPAPGAMIRVGVSVNVLDENRDARGYRGRGANNERYRDEQREERRYRDDD